MKSLRNLMRRSYTIVAVHIVARIAVVSAGYPCSSLVLLLFGRIRSLLQHPTRRTRRSHCAIVACSRSRCSCSSTVSQTARCSSNNGCFPSSTRRSVHGLDRYLWPDMRCLRVPLCRFARLCLFGCSDGINLITLPFPCLDCMCISRWPLIRLLCPFDLLTPVAIAGRRPPKGGVRQSKARLRQGRGGPST